MPTQEGGHAMSNARVTEAMRKLTETGGLLDPGPDLSRLLIRLMRELAQGRPVPRERVDQIIGDLGIAREGAYRSLRKWAERDADGNVFGIVGLSLNDTPHRFYVNGTRMSTWCAGDALYVPAVLGRT